MTRTNEATKAGERTQFTIGEWLVNPTGDIGDWLVGTSQTEIANCGGGDVPKKEMLANARLIAAGKELYYAAKKTKAFIDDLAESNPGYLGKLALQNYAQFNEAMIELPRAIDKAEGN